MEVIKQIPTEILLGIYFIPGFISVKVYQLFKPTQRMDFSKSLYEVLGYSSISFIISFGLIQIYWNNEQIKESNLHSWIAFFLILFVIPSLLSFIFFIIQKTKWFERKLISHDTAWDRFFEKRKGSFYALITFQDGSKIMGYYGTKSYATNNVDGRQIFLEKMYRYNKKENRWKQKESCKGLLIVEQNIKHIEFR